MLKSIWVYNCSIFLTFCIFFTNKISCFNSKNMSRIFVYLILNKKKGKIILISCDYILVITHTPQNQEFMEKKLLSILKRCKIHTHDYTAAFAPQKLLLSSTIIFNRILCSKQIIKKIMGEKKKCQIGKRTKSSVSQAVDDHFSILCVRFKFPCGSNLNLFFSFLRLLKNLIQLRYCVYVL